MHHRRRGGDRSAAGLPLQQQNGIRSRGSGSDGDERSDHLLSSSAQQQDSIINGTTPSKRHRGGNKSLWSSQQRGAVLLPHWLLQHGVVKNLVSTRRLRLGITLAVLFFVVVVSTTQDVTWWWTRLLWGPQPDSVRRNSSFIEPFSLFQNSFTASGRRRGGATSSSSHTMQLVLPSSLSSLVDDNAFFLPSHRVRAPGEPDFAELELAMPVDDGDTRRRVLDTDVRVYNRERKVQLQEIDHIRMNPKLNHRDELGPDRLGDGDCEPPSFYYDYYPSCNQFHEMSMERPAATTTTTTEEDPHTVFVAERPYNITFLGEGYFRASFIFQSAITVESSEGDSSSRAGAGSGQQQVQDEFVMKTLRLHEDHNFDPNRLNSIRVEAIALERLTKSPRVIDILGHCSFSMLVEPAKEITYSILPEQRHERGRIRRDVLDKLQADDVHPMNKYSALEKLQIALTFAEALADVHGYEEGVIVNGDVHPDQWLITRDGRIKVGDFNNANFLFWSQRNQTYCGYWSQYGGSYKSPEEYWGDYVVESVDVYAQGYNIYTLLTGLNPFYDIIDDNEKIREKVKHGELPYIDPRYRERSMIERRLIEVMERSLVYEPEKRIDIFTMVRVLRDILHQHEEHEKARRLIESLGLAREE